MDPYTELFFLVLDWKEKGKKNYDKNNFHFRCLSVYERKEKIIIFTFN